jgi:hypothetical protein
LKLATSDRIQTVPHQGRIKLFPALFTSHFPVFQLKEGNSGCHHGEISLIETGFKIS